MTIKTHPATCSVTFEGSQDAAGWLAFYTAAPASAIYQALAPQYARFCDDDGAGYTDEDRRAVCRTAAAYLLARWPERS